VPDQRALLERIVRADPDLVRLLAVVRELGLPQGRLVAGCLYGTVWNVLTGRPRRTGIKDYDLVYFDASDLSWAAENEVIAKVAAATSGFPGHVEVRNQARVHLWFEQRFGTPYPALACADEALLRYASVVHAVGVRLEPDGRLDVIAPFGLADLFAMVIRPNRVLENRASHDAKAARAKAIWPEVTVIPWDRDEATGSRSAGC
jgi:hypothetical protein